MAGSARARSRMTRRTPGIPREAWGRGNGSCEDLRGLIRLPSSRRARGEVLEPGELLEEREVDVPDGTRAVLREDHLGDPLLLGVRVVVVLSVEKQDGVGVLLDRSCLADVAYQGLAFL